MVDYSKFDNIDDSDDDIANIIDIDEKQIGIAKENANACKNCFKSCGKALVCGKCKAVTYCSVACQKEDWHFHKRNCNKPVPMEEAFQQKFPGAAFFGGSKKNELKELPRSKGATSKDNAENTETDNAEQSMDIKVANAELDKETFLQESDEQIVEESDDERAAIAEVVEKMVPTIWNSAARTTSDGMENIDVKETTTLSPKDEETNATINVDEGPKDSTIASSEKIDTRQGASRMTAPCRDCVNCGESCTKPLICSVCKDSVYCSQKCQKEDWRFHKKVCKRAKRKVFCRCGASFKDDHMFCFTCGARRPDENKADDLGEPLRLNQSEPEHVDDEEVGEWYRHREWKPEHKQDFPPQPLDIENKSTIENNDQNGKRAGSAWNAAGTWEDKNMLPWWVNRLASLELGVQDEGLLLKVDQIVDVEGEAAIVHTRGTTRFTFDLKFWIDFQVEKDETNAAGFAMQTTSNGRVQVLDFCDGARENCEMKLEGSNSAVDIAGVHLLPKLKDALISLIHDYEKEEFGHRSL